MRSRGEEAVVRWRARARALAMACLASLLVLGPGAGVAQEASGGATAFSRGHFEQAVAAWSRAYDAASGAGDARRAAEALLGRAEAYQALGYYPRSIEDLRAALTLAERVADPSLTARLHGSLGNALFLSDDRAGAAEALGQCLAHAEAANDIRLQAQTWNNLGNVLAETSRRTAAAPSGIGQPGAGEAFANSLRLAEQSGDDLLAANALVNTARLARMGSRAAEARALLRRAGALYREAPESSVRTQGLLAVARLLMEGRSEGDWAASRDLVFALLEEAATSARRLSDPRSLAYASGYLGSAHERDGRGEEALRLSTEALFASLEAGAPESTYLWQWQIGRLLEARGDLAGARAALEGAVGTLRTLRGDLAAQGGGAGAGLGGPERAVYLDLVDLLFRSAEQQPSPDAAQADLLAARSTMELLKTAELEDYFRDDCVAVLQAKTKAVDQLMAGAAALYPILLPDRTELLLSLPSGLRRITVPVGAAEMNETVLALRRLLEKRTRQYLRPARKVYDWLVRPLEEDLESSGVQTLVFVPSGLLRTIPIAALHDGKRHLVERYATAVVPGLSLLDPRPIERETTSVLLAGLTEPVQGFEGLPHVAAEIAAISELYGGRVFRDAEFSAGSLQQALEVTPYSIVHVASC
jgi:tetratricopeptide (TPR) repeat protein